MRTAIVLVALLSAAAVPAAAPAAFPGENGRIAWVRAASPSGGTIYTAQYTSTGHRRVTDPSYRAGEPDWSADGTRLAFWTNRDSGNVDVYTATADGRDLHRVTTNPAYDAHPSWSPDGRRIAFARGTWFDDRDAAIVVADAAGGGETVVAQHAFNPAWSPAGDLIAFNRVDAATTDCFEFCPSELWVVRPDGTGERRLATGAREAAWNPASTRIAFLRATGPRGYSPPDHVWTIAPDGSNELDTLQPTSDLKDLEWSPSGSGFIFARSVSFGTWNGISQTYDIGGSGLNQDNGGVITHGIEPDWQACRAPGPACPGELPEDAGEDYLGSSTSDLHYSRSTADLVDGFFGSDRLAGGFGDDRVLGGGGDDRLAGDYCLPGDVEPDGRGGTDRIGGGDGDDHLFGCGGNDYLDGGTDYDELHGGEGDDVLVGGDGPTDPYDYTVLGDELDGGPGDDRLEGGADPDALDGGPGSDVYRAGAGDDVVTSIDPPGPGFTAAEPVDCGDGDDLVRPSALDVLAPDCERVGLGPGSVLVMRAQPAVTARRGLRFTVPCPDDARRGCTGRVTAETRRGRAIGSRVYAVGRGQDVHVTVANRRRSAVRGAVVHVAIEWRYARRRGTRVVAEFTVRVSGG